MKRSKFSLGYSVLGSSDMGELVPIGLTEVLPGDSIQMNSQMLIRCAPMLSPPLHPVRVRIHHWFVPHRLVWTNWENFITGGPDGLNNSVFPTKNLGSAVVQGTLLNYLGLPVTASAPPVFSALPLRGYGLIWNEWYRDQDLQTLLTVSQADGSDSSTNSTLQRCAWEKDYFTSARPFEQKGPAVSIPLVGNAPVRGIGITGVPASGPAGSTHRESTPLPNRAYPFSLEGNKVGVEVDGVGSGTVKPLVYADLSAVSGVTINDLRDALAIQRFEEARAMYGSRYVEYLAHLGVRSSDARLQRPEYLGGGRQTIQFSEVVQSAADGANPVSTLRGHGISAMQSNRFRRFFEEHGYIHTLMSVLPKTVYSNGLFRHWNRRTKFDYWQRELEFVGQQAILNKEVYLLHSSPDGVFGYQDRYDEYRRSESRVVAEFATSTLDYWHFARNFVADPALNAAFVSSVPSERPFAAPSTDVLFWQIKHSIQARRMLSRTAVPRTF